MVWDLQNTLVDLKPAQVQLSTDFPIIKKYLGLKKQLGQGADKKIKKEMQVIRPKAVSIFTREMESGKYHLPVFPGVVDHLQAMKQQDYRNGIFSSTPLKVIKDILESNGLAESIDCIVNLPMVIDRFSLGNNVTKEDVAVNLGMYAIYAQKANGGQVKTYTDDEANQITPVVAAQALLVKGGKDLDKVLEQFPALAPVVEMHEKQGGIGAIYHFNPKADTRIVGKEGYTQINRFDLAQPMNW